MTLKRSWAIRHKRNSSHEISAICHAESIHTALGFRQQNIYKNTKNKLDKLAISRTKAL